MSKEETEHLIERMRVKIKSQKEQIDTLQNMVIASIED